jgi:hypothetical protein
LNGSGRGNTIAAFLRASQHTEQIGTKSGSDFANALFFKLFRKKQTGYHAQKQDGEQSVQEKDLRTGFKNKVE